MESFYKKKKKTHSLAPGQTNRIRTFLSKVFAKFSFFPKGLCDEGLRTESGSEEPCLFGSGYRLGPRHDPCGEDDVLSVGRAAFEVLMRS